MATKITLDNAGAIALAAGIIEQTKLDYIKAVCYKDEELLPMPMYNDDGKLKMSEQPAAVVRNYLEKYVRSKRFSMLTMDAAAPDEILISWLEEAKNWWTAQMFGKNRRKIMPKLRHKSCIDRRIK